MRKGPEEPRETGEGIGERTPELHISIDPGGWGGSACIQIRALPGSADRMKVLEVAQTTWGTPSLIME